MTITLRSIKGEPLSHNELDGNFTDLQDQIDGKAATSHDHLIEDITGLQSALDAKQNISTLGLWDYWYENLFGSSSTAAPNMFVGAAISSGTNTTAIPTASLLGYNPYGVFLRSSTTANGGYRYLTTSLVSDYFGTIGHKFWCQFLWRTSFTGRNVRMGYFDTNTVSDAVDGAYFQISDDIVYAKTANNSTRTTHGTTYTLSLNTPYTFDIEVNQAGTEARYRIYAGISTTAVYDQTITTNIPTSSGRTFGAGIVATESSTTVSEIGILYRLGIGTIAGFNKWRN